MGERLTGVGICCYAMVWMDVDSHHQEPQQQLTASFNPAI